MASQGRWMHGDGVPVQLARELSECLWWVLVIARRPDVEIAGAFAATMDDLDARLTTRLAQPR